MEQIQLHCGLEKIIDIRPFDGKEATHPTTFVKEYGNNYYSKSNVHQWLNSDANAGEWYTPTHTYDAPPTAETIEGNTQYADKHGFLYYFTKQEKAILSTLPVM